MYQISDIIKVAVKNVLDPKDAVNFPHAYHSQETMKELHEHVTRNEGQYEDKILSFFPKGAEIAGEIELDGFKGSQTKISMKCTVKYFKAFYDDDFKKFIENRVSISAKGPDEYKVLLDLERIKE
jgi:hypothetical protein